MSSGGTITPIIRSIIYLLSAVNDLRLAYKEKAQIGTADGKIHNVDIVVKDENNRDIGFQKQKDGTFAVIADSTGLNSTQLKKQNDFINKIKRRYAYNVVIQELRKEGYQIAEEKQVEKDMVKLTARRWRA